MRYKSYSFETFLNHLLDSFPRGKKLLELGCDSGRDAAFLYSMSYDVYLSNRLEKMIYQLYSFQISKDSTLFLIFLFLKFSVFQN